MAFLFDECIYNFFIKHEIFNITKINYLSNKPRLTSNPVFVKKIFIEHIATQSIPMLDFLKLYCSTILDEPAFVQEVYDNNFSTMSNELCEWFINNFIDLNIFGLGDKHLTNIMSSSNLNKFNLYVSHTVKTVRDAEMVLKMTLEYDALELAKSIFGLYPKMNMYRLNGTLIGSKNHFNISTSRRDAIVQWIKSICKPAEYLVIVELDKLTIIDNFIESQCTVAQAVKLMQADDYDPMCSFCCETNIDVVSNCSHTACYYCMKDWLCKKGNKSCPFCRKTDGLRFYYV